MRFFLKDYQSEGSFDTLFDMFYRNQNIYDLWLAIHDFPALIKACCIYLVDHLKGLVIFSNNKHYNGQNGKKKLYLKENCQIYNAQISTNKPYFVEYYRLVMKPGMIRP